MSRRTLSASQVDTYLDCNRKWAWRYIGGIKTPPHPSAELGTHAHSVAEAYLEHGTLPDHAAVVTLPTSDGRSRDVYPGRIIEAGLHYLPKPGSGKVEEEFRYESPEGVSWQGRIDWNGVIEGGIPLTLDHKTTSDFRWAKTSEDLETDNQSILYAKVALDKYPDAPYALNRWVYYRTRGAPKAQAVDVSLTREHVDTEMSRLNKVGKTILSLYEQVTDPKDLPPNTSVCEKFGGCPYQNHCQIGIVERWTAHMAQETVEQLIARKKAEAAARATSAVVPPPVPAPVEPPPAPVAPPPPAPASFWTPSEPMNVVQQMMKSKGAPLSAIALLADVPPPKNVADTYDSGAWVVPSAVNPPEAPSVAPASPEQLPPPPVAQVSTDMEADDLEAMGRDQLKELAMRLGVSTPEDKTRAEGLKTKIREARRNGLTPKTLPPRPISVPPPPVVVPPPARVPTPLPPPPAPVAVSPTAPTAPAATYAISRLYVNCRPVDGGAVEISTILATVFEKMREDTKLPDYRLEEFGKGIGRLAAYLEGVLKDAPPSAVVVDSRTPEGAHCLETLKRLAAHIVQGF